MKFLPFFKNNTPCGLDIGEHWTKTVHLRRSRKGATLDKMGLLFGGRSNLNNKSQIASKIRHLWQSIQLKNKLVISSMTGHAVIIKRLDLSVSNTQRPEEAIHHQAQQHIPFDINDVYFDFQIMGPGTEKGTKDVLLVASKKQMVEELKEVFEMAELGLSTLDVDGFALSNCFEFNYPEEMNKSSYLLDIGASHGIFCVYSQKNPIFVRDIGIGGQQINERLASLLNVNQTQVEKYKLTGFQDIEQSDIKKIQTEIKNIFANWVQEIYRMSNFFKTNYENYQYPDTIYLSGGASLIPGLKDKLSQELGLQVHYLDPWRKIYCDDYSFDSKYLQSIGPQFSIAVGLALRAIS